MQLCIVTRVRSLCFHTDEVHIRFVLPTTLVNLGNASEIGIWEVRIFRFLRSRGTIRSLARYCQIDYCSLTFLLVDRMADCTLYRLLLVGYTVGEYRDKE